MKQYTNQFNFAPNNDSAQDSLFKNYCDLDLSKINNLKALLPEEELIDILELMIQKSGNDKSQIISFFNKLNKDGYALIHYICYLQYNKALKFLLENGTLSNVASCIGITPLEISIKMRDEVRF